LELPAGEHLVHLSSAVILEELTISIEANQTQEIIRIYEEVPLRFEVPSNTEIRVDGVHVGTAPMEAFLTLPGVRMITLTPPNGEESETRMIQVGIRGATLKHSWE
jgi:hypothetical protein